MDNIRSEIASALGRKGAMTVPELVGHLGEGTELKPDVLVRVAVRALDKMKEEGDVTLEELGNQRRYRLAGHDATPPPAADKPPPLASPKAKQRKLAPPGQTKEAILSAMKRLGGVGLTAQDIAVQANMESRKVPPRLSDLTRQGKIAKVGGHPGGIGRWSLLKEPVTAPEPAPTPAPEPPPTPEDPDPAPLPVVAKPKPEEPMTALESPLADELASESQHWATIRALGAELAASQPPRLDDWELLCHSLETIALHHEHQSNPTAVQRLRQAALYIQSVHERGVRQ